MKELVIVGGANGSGKTTFSKQMIAEMGFEFLNADEIEKELATSKLEAGKEFFRRLAEYTLAEKSFILESTLSGNYLLKIIKNLRNNGYKIRIVYVFLESPQDCIYRIKLRVKLGGHFVPNDDVIRRYYRSKNNFWNTYKNLADDWLMIYNSSTEEPQKVAFGIGENFVIETERLFNDFLNDVTI